MNINNDQKLEENNFQEQSFESLLKEFQ